MRAKRRIRNRKLVHLPLFNLPEDKLVEHTENGFSLEIPYKCFNKKEICCY